MTGVARRGKNRASAADAQNRYDAGGMGRRIARWSPPASGPQKAVAPGFERARSRVHDAVRNDWAANSSATRWGSNLIGVGIQPRWAKIGAAGKRYRAIWDEFSKTADADGIDDAYGLQLMLVYGLVDGGEVFMRRRPRRLTSPLDVPMQIQLIEGEYCPMFDADQWTGLPAGNKIRQGIELDAYGTRTAYWFYREHPGDGAVTPSQDQLIRVAASQVSHLFYRRRPGQLRGVSPLLTVLARLRASGDLEEAVLERQRLANLFALFVTRPAPPDDEFDLDPLTGLPAFYKTDGAPMVGLEPGIAQELRPGEDIKFAAPPAAGVGFAEYQRGLNLGTAAGQDGLPYELMTGDIRDVSDRTMRLVLQEFRRVCQQKQWLVLIPRGCQKMVEWCMEGALMAGRLTAAEMKAACAPVWQPQGWEYIHPVQDAQGKKLELEMGVISKSDIISERGDDPEEVFDSRQADAKAEDDRGLTPPEPAPAGAPAQGKPGQQNSMPTASADSAPIAGLLGLVTAMQAQNAAMVEAMQAQNTAVLAAVSDLAKAFASQPAPVMSVTLPPVEPTPVNVAAPVVNVAAPVVNVEPATVQVDNHIEPTPVNVAAPNVSVVNEVKPADVNVDVNLPARETTSVIDRDRDGNIVNVKQTERTIQ